MNGERERAAWADYWTGGGNGRPTCVPNASSGVEAAQREIWDSFAGRLPRRARVLDIGTGDGAVLAVLAARRDLELIGVDSAPALPSAPKGMKLTAGVAAERLPFPDGRFDAVVSQFGFEYADTGQAAAEAGRVLRAGGAVQLIVHHRGGPIVAHNRIRRDALAWACGESDLLGRARALAAARRVAPLPTPEAFRAAIREAQLRFGPGSGADELAEAIWRTLEGGRVRQAEEAVAMLETLTRRAQAEMTRIEGLLAAARDEAGIAALAEELNQANIATAPPQPVSVSQARAPIAWLVSGARRRTGG